MPFAVRNGSNSLVVFTVLSTTGVIGPMTQRSAPDSAGHKLAAVFLHLTTPHNVQYRTVTGPYTRVNHPQATLRYRIAPTSPFSSLSLVHNHVF
jgi:hypothetical protein